MLKQIVYPNGKEFFDINLIEGDKVTKLSVFAPAQSTMRLNNRMIKIGNSQIYDFSSDTIELTSLEFKSSENGPLSRVVINYITKEEA